jgi:hypothetical protein
MSGDNSSTVPALKPQKYPEIDKIVHVRPYQTALKFGVDCELVAVVKMWGGGAQALQKFYADKSKIAFDYTVQIPITATR